MIRIYICGYISCVSFPDNFKGSGVKDHEFSSQLSSVSDSCRSTATAFLVVGSQQCPSNFHQPMVPVEHTAIVIRTAHIHY